MKFNEWMTQTKGSFGDSDMTEDSVLENQMEQWVNKLVGLLHSVPEDKKQKLLEKVIQSLNNI
jgi:uncharacterized protein (DUF608 family)